MLIADTDRHSDTSADTVWYICEMCVIRKRAPESFSALPRKTPNTGFCEVFSVREQQFCEHRLYSFELRKEPTDRVSGCGVVNEVFRIYWFLEG